LELAESIRFEPGSPNEKRLLQLLRDACVNTFGTSDYSALHNEKEGVTKNKGFSSLAMGSLLRQFDRKPEINKPNKAEMATPRKPSD
jgi:hypothetical protein